MWGRKKRFHRGQEAGKLTAGVQHSPGLALIYEHFKLEKPRAVLDLGASSKENLEELSKLSQDILIQDSFHTVGALAGERGEIFDFGAAADVDLPDRDEDFDLILIWDLLHYWRKRHEAASFAGRVVQRLAPGGLVLVMASAQVPIPPSPIHFKIVDSGRLDYQLDGQRVPSPGLPMRAVEKMLAPCTPIRVYQLRNGLQEFVLRRPPAEA